ncbi:MAG TPA: hypothetical protein VLN56_02010 [Gammaproteobacteria bacterium]|nr:hypothetical protein [Gammaproteobacteria bacterium]
MPEEPGIVVVREDEGSILMGMIWMAVITLLLFWLPAIGPLIAGIVGGKVAGGVGAGFVAALLPGLILAGILFFAGTMLTGIPLIGAIFAMSSLLLVTINIIPLLIGALIGGLLA